MGDFPDMSGAKANAAAEWPEPFFANSAGIWFQPSKKDTKPTAIWICAPFEVIAETADEAGSSWGMLLRWRDRDGRQHEWAMPRRLLHLDGNQIASELETEGLAVGTGKDAHELLKSLLGRITTPDRRRCVVRAGWHQTDAGRVVYVLPSGETFGPPDNTGIILQTDHATKSDATRARGTLKEWQENVAALAIGNHRLGLFLAAAFVGPLLDITTEQSGGLHLHGGSQTGKTTALRVAASVWGLADTSGQIRTWRATSNGMEGVDMRRAATAGRTEHGRPEGSRRNRLFAGQRKRQSTSNARWIRAGATDVAPHIPVDRRNPVGR
jgi:putative DNA primase/helicase